MSPAATLPRPLVAIHQPNFFPWLGYFDKLSRADVFVLLDDVQFPKKGGTPINRVKLLVNGAPAWVTVPVDRSYHGTRSIREMRIDEARPWRDKLLGTIRASYGRAPAFAEVSGLIAEVIRNQTDQLTSYNISAIKSLAGELGIRTEKLVLSSELDVEGTATELLIAIVRSVGGGGYLAGGGAGGYQEDERFAEAGLGLVYQNFRHPEYPQRAGEPAPGLSVIDALMNCGFGGTASLLGRGS